MAHSCGVAYLPSASDYCEVSAAIVFSFFVVTIRPEFLNELQEWEKDDQALQTTVQSSKIEFQVFIRLLHFTLFTNKAILKPYFCTAGVPQ